MKDIIRIIKSSLLISSGDVVLCALSGGADSMALLAALNELSGEMGFAVFAAHLNHGIRENAAKDEQFVKNFCKTRAIRLICGHEDVPSYAAMSSKSLETAARELRYAFLQRAARQVHANKIALAHHMGDQAETLLLNLGRGVGLNGMCGMRARNGVYIRPLLDVSKDDLLGFLHSRGIPHREDESNTDESYTRNRVRRIVSELAKAMPAFVKSCGRFAKLAQADEQYLSQVAEGEWTRLYNSGLDFAGLLKLDAAISTRVLRIYAAKQGLDVDFERVHADDILALQGTGKMVCLPHGYEARLTYGVLTIERAAGKPSADKAAFLAPLAIPGFTVTPDGTFAARVIARPDSLVPPNGMCAYAPPGLTAFVRYRQTGDVIRVFGGGGKKLKKLYIDNKVPREQRDLPLIAHETGVLWAIGAGVSEDLRITDENEIVEITFDRKTGP